MDLVDKRTIDGEITEENSRRQETMAKIIDC